MQEPLEPGMRMNQENKTDSAFPQHKVTLVWNRRVSDSIWELQWRPQQHSSSILHCLCCWASLWLANHPAQLCSFHPAVHTAQDYTTQEFLRNLSFYSYVFKSEAFYTHISRYCGLTFPQKTQFSPHSNSLLKVLIKALELILLPSVKTAHIPV